MTGEGWPWAGYEGWSKPVSADEANRRAGGRRRYNAERQRAREERRDRLAALVVETWPRFMTDRGWQTWAALQLGVDRATVCRDVAGILADAFDGPVAFVITYRLLRALMPTPAEAAIIGRLANSQ